MGSGVQNLGRMTTLNVIDRPSAFQPIGCGFKSGEGLHIAFGQNEGQGLAPVYFDQNRSFGKLVRSRAKASGGRKWGAADAATQG